MWVAAVKRKDSEPTEHCWLCSAHFVSDCKSSDPLSPDYVPRIFSHVRNPQKRRAEQDLTSYTRRKEARRKRSEAVSRETACQALLSLSDETVANDLDEVGTVETGTGTMTEAKYLGLKDAETMTDLSMCDILSVDALDRIVTI